MIYFCYHEYTEDNEPWVKVMSEQEFTSEKNCMIALDAVKSNGRWATFVYATCVQK